MVVVAIGLAAAALVFIYAGLYNVAADDAHTAPVYALLEIVRDRSIAVRSRDIQVPVLEAPGMIATGARHYDAMCAECHRAPGQRESELRRGLYPQPPDLTRHVHANVAEKFWIIKHGIKLSGMPAWGQTHDDAGIWALVAFLGKLPELTPAQYQALAQAHSATGHEHSPRGHPDGNK